MGLSAFPWVDKLMFYLCEPDRIIPECHIQNTQ